MRPLDSRKRLDVRALDILADCLQNQIAGLITSIWLPLKKSGDASTCSRRLLRHPHSQAPHDPEWLCAAKPTSEVVRCQMSDAMCQMLDVKHLNDKAQEFHCKAPFHSIAKFQLAKSRKDIPADDRLLSMKSSCPECCGKCPRCCEILLNGLTSDSAKQ